MNDKLILQDERTRAVENEGSRLGFTILLFGLLLDITVRSFFFSESNWDLFALLIVSSLTATVYQALHKALPPRFLRSALILGAVSSLVAVLIVLILAKLR